MIEEVQWGSINECGLKYYSRSTYTLTHRPPVKLNRRQKGAVSHLSNHPISEVREDGPRCGPNMTHESL